MRIIIDKTVIAAKASHSSSNQSPLNGNKKFAVLLYHVKCKLSSKVSCKILQKILKARILHTKLHIKVYFTTRDYKCVILPNMLLFRFMVFKIQITCLKLVFWNRFGLFNIELKKANTIRIIIFKKSGGQKTTWITKVAYQQH